MKKTADTPLTSEQGVGPNQSGNEAWKQAKSGNAVPGIEVAVGEIGEECPETEYPGQEEKPPGPRLPLLQGKLGQPEVEHTDGDQCSPKGNPIVDHEVNHAATVMGAQFFRGHAKELLVVRQELSRDAQEEAE